MATQTTANVGEELYDRLTEQIRLQGHPHSDEDVVERAALFVPQALKRAYKMIEDNRTHAIRASMDADPIEAMAVFDPDNVREITVRSNLFGNPELTVWLRDCPMWANTASNEEILVANYEGQPTYNGSYVTAKIDVRPF